MHLVPTGHLLFFASPKKSKQKKGDPDVQVWLRQTSLTPHPFFGACELVCYGLTKLGSLKWDGAATARRQLLQTEYG